MTIFTRVESIQNGTLSHRFEVVAIDAKFGAVVVELRGFGFSGLVKTPNVELTGAGRLYRPASG